MNKGMNQQVNESMNHSSTSWLFWMHVFRRKKEHAHTCVLDTFSIVCKSVLDKTFIDWVLWHEVKTPGLQSELKWSKTELACTCASFQLLLQTLWTFCSGHYFTMLGCFVFVVLYEYPPTSWSYPPGRLSAVKPGGSFQGQISIPVMTQVLKCATVLVWGSNWKRRYMRFCRREM